MELAGRCFLRGTVPTDGVQPLSGCAESVAGALKAWIGDQLEGREAKVAEHLIQRRLTPELSRTALRRRQSFNHSELCRRREAVSA